ncbi:transaldolase [Helicobacter muridarum]|uniref:Transaldolase n=1 Tax=Helicobacter muridarum TaxID=216 RepID=A0A099U0N9_9HELI|nr:transaldolase [Helicobacter muridarum]TLD99834.1 transaldolase [Helicobacter muridarum]STQ86957.1 transaldolase [Helicobacter muridarum]
MISIWCDFIEREFLRLDFRELVNKGLVNGATSNPNIFAEALKGDSYSNDIEFIFNDSSIQSMPKDMQKKAIYEHLALQDIKIAADILLPLYDENPMNGLISIEIDPYFCNNIDSSVNEGKRLWESLKCSNVMIKVPATSSGFVIMEQLMSIGINVNATLVFSQEQAQKTLKAFQEGYKQLNKNLASPNASINHAVANPQGVISVFVSRFDREIDSKLDFSLRGKYGICNATVIYHDFLTRNNNKNFRILFASTGVKEQNSTYNDLGYYVYPLAFPDCINTVPLSTLRSINYDRLDGQVSSEFSNSLLNDIRDRLHVIGVDYRHVEANLLDQGLRSFQASFKDMLDSLVKKDN